MSDLHDAWKAVPLVPGTEEDCCARLQHRLDLPSRDIAATWLAFLRAVDLVVEGPSGFTRVRDAPETDAIARTLRSNVYGAREVLDVLVATDGPVDATTIAERTGAVVTGWERRKHGPDWPAVWRERIADLLDWLVLLGLAEATDPGYRAAGSD